MNLNLIENIIIYLDLNIDLLLKYEDYSLKAKKVKDQVPIL